MSDMKMLSKLMEKKKGESLDPEYKKSKMDVLKALHEDMGKLMGEDMKGLKKVTVAAPDKMGLEEGLAKAKDMLGGKEESMEEPSEEEMMESPEMEASEDEPKTPEEIEAKIKELEALKAKMLMMKA